MAVAAALAMSALTLALLPWRSAVAAAVAALTVAAFMAILMRRQIGGYTGDALGATEVKVELAVLATAVAMAA